MSKASRWFGKVLRHGGAGRWTPMRDNKYKSACAEILFNAAVADGIAPPEEWPRDICECFRLSQRDVDRPRFMMLVREPSLEEPRNENLRPYTIFEGDHKNLLLLRIRAVQGHSGTYDPCTFPPFLKRIEDRASYPQLLMHSTKLKFLESISNLGILPGRKKSLSAKRVSARFAQR